jgi:hypothetical protein
MSQPKKKTNTITKNIKIAQLINKVYVIKGSGNNNV